MKVMIKRIITSVILGLLFWFSFIILPPFLFSVVLATILFLIIFFEWVKFFKTHGISFWLLTLIYPVLPFVLLIVMNHIPEYRLLLLPLFIIVSSLDTGSYIVGNLIGIHKICPRVSPGKTWEGFFGGYIIACISLGVLLLEQKIIHPWWQVMSFVLVVCLLALCGDLFESLLKRRARLKDSGTLLPGQGGFLDRFDGILFVAVFFFFFRNYLVVFFK